MRFSISRFSLIFLQQLKFPRSFNWFANLSRAFLPSAWKIFHLWTFLLDFPFSPFKFDAWRRWKNFFDFSDDWGGGGGGRQSRKVSENKKRRRTLKFINLWGKFCSFFGNKLYIFIMSFPKIPFVRKWCGAWMSVAKERGAFVETDIISEIWISDFFSLQYTWCVSYFALDGGNDIAV